jgi:hypothetical protein
MPPFDISSLPKVISSHFQRTDATQATGRLGSMTVTEGKAETPPAQTSSFKEKAASFFHSVGQFFSKIGDRISQAFHDLKAKWTPEAPTNTPVQAPQVQTTATPQKTDTTTKGNASDSAERASNCTPEELPKAIQTMVDKFKTEEQRPVEQGGSGRDWDEQLFRDLGGELSKLGPEKATERLDAMLDTIRNEPGALSEDDVAKLKDAFKTLKDLLSTTQGLAQFATDRFLEDLPTQAQNSGTFFRGRSAASASAGSLSNQCLDVGARFLSKMQDIMEDPEMAADSQLIGSCKVSQFGQKETEAMGRILDKLLQELPDPDDVDINLRAYVAQTTEAIVKLDGLTDDQKSKLINQQVSNTMFLRGLGRSFSDALASMDGNDPHRQALSNVQTFLTRIAGNVTVANGSTEEGKAAYSVLFEHIAPIMTNFTMHDAHPLN